MSEPSRSTSRHVIAGATLAVIGVAAAGFALGRSTAEPAPTSTVAAVQPSPSPTPTPTPALPAIQSPLARPALIAAAADAASAFAAGRLLPAEVAALGGREFELLLPFACPGPPPPEGAALGSDYDAEEEALRVRAEPVRWTPAEWLPPDPAAPEAVPTAEAIEGFWIARPWIAEADCPAPSVAPAADVPSAPTEPTLGIAQIFGPESSRVGRRDGQPYRAVASVAPDALDLRQGLRLRLRGRVAARPSPILCKPGAGTDARPVCLIVASLDEVAVFNPSTQVTLATWDVASKDARAAR